MAIPEPIYTDVLCTGDLTVIATAGILVLLFVAILHALIRGILRGRVKDPPLEERK